MTVSVPLLSLDLYFIKICYTKVLRKIIGLIKEEEETWFKKAANHVKSNKRTKDATSGEESRTVLVKHL